MPYKPVRIEPSEKGQAPWFNYGWRQSPMQLKSNNRARISPGSAVELEANKNKKLQDTPYYPLLWVIAALMDETADGGNSYCIVGSTQSGNSMSMAIYSGGNRATAYADKLVDLGQAAAELVSD